MSKSEVYQSEALVEQLIRQYDETSMPVPEFEGEPLLLISKVRKHYMEYLIKLLSENYETNQQLLNKNIYLPSAIWRCAKEIEMSAAQTCMVVQLYRRNIVTAVKEVVNDTKKKKLNRKLYECLHTPPKNEKKTQTNVSLPQDCSCNCNCKQVKKRRKPSRSPKQSHNMSQTTQNHSEKQVNKIPVLINSKVEPFENNASVNRDVDLIKPSAANTGLVDSNKNISNIPLESKLPSNIKSFVPADSHQPSSSNQPFDPSMSVRMSVDSESDDLMLQLEKLFQSDPNDPNDDDLFDLYFGDPVPVTMSKPDCGKKIHNENTNCLKSAPVQVDTSVIESHTNQIKSLDERLESLAGLLSNTVSSTTKPIEDEPRQEIPRPRRMRTSKWLCEEHFLRTKLLELLDEIGEHNRKRLAQLKEFLTELFGEDSDNEGVMSPLEESAEFMVSCKERIAPWVVKLLTPHYARGYIRGKTLFKSLAKHLIRLIIQCSRYPQEYEVHSFVTDFMKTHKLIRCEADFKQFRIENI